jgi:hypothetical protein
MTFHIIFIFEHFYMAINCKRDQKMLTNTYLYIMLCMLLILYRVSHAFYVMVSNNYL